MKILAFFTSNGIPAMGLVPIIRIRNLLDNSLVVTDAIMAEVGDGHYQYNFTSYNKDIDYAIRCDGGISLSGMERYTYAGNENYIDDISETITETTSGSNTTINTKLDNIITDISQVASDVWEEKLADHTLLGTYGAELATKADIASSSSTNETVATSGAVIIGTETSGTLIDTYLRDGAYWLINEAITGLTVQLGFYIPNGERAGVFKVFGHYIGVPQGTHYMQLWAYNFTIPGWELLKEVFMPGGNTSDSEFISSYFERHINRDNNNEIRIRLIHSVATYNVTHQLFIDYAAVTSIDVITAKDIANAVWDETLIGHNLDNTFGQSIQNSSANILSASAAIRNDLVDLNTKIDSLSGDIGTQIVSLSASNQVNFNLVNNNITNLDTKITAISGSIVDISNDLKKVLGLVHENIFIDNPTYDGDGNMTSARVRIYSNPASVGTGNDVIGTYQVSAPSSAPGQFITWSQIRI
jgi:hypothetical protein